MPGEFVDIENAVNWTSPSSSSQPSPSPLVLPRLASGLSCWGSRRALAWLTLTTAWAAVPTWTIV